MSVAPRSFTKVQLSSAEASKIEEFEGFEHRVKKSRIQDVESYGKLLWQVFPDNIDRRKYRDWWAARQEKPAKIERQPPLSPSEYLLKLQNADYSDTSELTWLHDRYLHRNRPVPVIGTSRDITYKVTLGQRLQPRESCENTKDTRHLLLHNVLGINDNVEPNLDETLRRRLNPSLSEESTEITNSDDYNQDAFHVFHQIGALMYYDGDYNKDPGAAMADKSRWKDTGFAVVSDVTSGRARGVWIVYDFFPVDEDISGDRYHVDDSLDWGWLPNHEGEDDPTDDQFSVAKIADSLADLGPEYELKLEHMLRHEPEIVHAVRAEDGKLLRRTIDRKNPERNLS